MSLDGGARQSGQMSGLRWTKRLLRKSSLGLR